MENIVDTIITLVLVFGSVILHEIAHGYMAWRLGDPTARMRGRLTLNPLAHIDPFGTILVPLVLSFGPGPVLGWAKPVPIDASYFRDARRGIMLTGAAGPATNFAIAVAAALLLRIVVLVPGMALLAVLLLRLVKINVFLGLFNLFPIPPLDGSRVMVGLIPHQWVIPYLRIERYGLFIVFGLLYLNVLDRILVPVADFFLKILFLGRISEFWHIPLLDAFARRMSGGIG